MSDKMREAFEENIPFGFSAKNSDGEYIDHETSVWFDEFSRGWEAALSQQPESDRPWIELAACLYQACGAYGLPERILDALSLAQRGEPFGHLIDGLLPCCPQPSAQVRVPTEIEAEKIADDCRCEDGTYNLVEVVEKLAKFMAPHSGEGEQR